MKKILRIPPDWWYNKEWGRFVIKFPNSLFFLLLACFICIHTACDLTPRTTVTGVVTVYRNGEPWKPDHLVTNRAASTARNQPPPPPYDRPRIYAFTKPDKYPCVGGDDTDYPLNDTDRAQGKYPWTMEIESRSLPGLIYFDVYTPMAGLLPTKMTKGIWVEEGSVVDLGIIDYDVIRLSGNLPVTVNGESLSGSPDIYITKMDNSYFDYAYINSNGNWLKDVFAQESETPLIFTLKTQKGGGVFRKILNPDHVITIKDIDKEIVFPDNPSVDFTAFLLSGTIDFQTSRDRQWLNIHFYDSDYTDDSLIGTVFYRSSEIKRDESGFSVWKTMVPAFSFPKELLFKVNYSQESSILISDYSEIDNLHLGTFIYD